MILAIFMISSMYPGRVGRATAEGQEPRRLQHVNLPGARSPRQDSFRAFLLTEVDRHYYELLQPAIARAYHLHYDEKALMTAGEEGYFWKDAGAVKEANEQ